MCPPKPRVRPGAVRRWQGQRFVASPHGSAVPLFFTWPLSVERIGREPGRPGARRGVLHSLRAIGGALAGSQAQVAAALLCSPSPAMRPHHERDFARGARLWLARHRPRPAPGPGVASGVRTSSVRSDVQCGVQTRGQLLLLVRRQLGRPLGSALVIAPACMPAARPCPLTRRSVEKNKLGSISDSEHHPPRETNTGCVRPCMCLAIGMPPRDVSTEH